jgi:uncharacterized protein YdaU (DUF1376 family)
MTRPWYRRFPDNFIAGTVGLSLEEKGAYSLILDLIYVRGGPVPDEPRYISGVCNCSVRKWNAIRQRLIDLGKIEVVDGRLMNRRAEKELENAAKTAEELAENGAKGGNKTAEKRGTASKNKGIAAAPVQHVRASQLQDQDSVLKSGNSFLNPTESLVRVDRRIDRDLFEACLVVTGEEVKAFIEHKSFPVSVVAEAGAALQARRELEAKLFESIEAGAAH